MAKDLATSLFGSPTPMESQPTEQEQKSLSVQEEYNTLLAKHGKVSDELEHLKSVINSCSEQTRKEIHEKLGEG